MKKAFTLIELLIVILVIGILAAMGIPQYFKAVEKSRIAEANNMFANIKNSQERYHLKKLNYTNNWEEIDIGVKNASGVDCTGTGACTLKFFNIQVVSNSNSNFLINATRLGTTQRYGSYVVNYLGPAGTISCNNAYCSAELID